MSHVTITRVTYTDPNDATQTISKPIANGIQIGYRNVTFYGKNIGHPSVPPNTIPMDGHVINGMMQGGGGMIGAMFGLATQQINPADYEEWNSGPLSFNADGTYTVYVFCPAELDTAGPYTLNVVANPQAILPFPFATAAAALADAPIRTLLIIYPFLLAQFGFGSDVPRPVGFGGFVSAGETLTCFFLKDATTLIAFQPATVLGNFWYCNFGPNIPVGPGEMLVFSSDLALKMSVDVNVV
jgi:hypothetical protein